MRPAKAFRYAEHHRGFHSGHVLARCRRSGQTVLHGSRSHAFRSRGRARWRQPGGWPNQVALQQRCGRHNRATLAAGSSQVPATDVGGKESVTRTVAGREVVLWRNSTGELVAGPAPARISAR